MPFASFQVFIKFTHCIEQSQLISQTLQASGLMHLLFLQIHFKTAKTNKSGGVDHDNYWGQSINKAYRSTITHVLLKAFLFLPEIKNWCSWYLTVCSPASILP